ncbi:MAG: hypothetical protein ABIA97_06540 [Candidatus Omnitrophota bacterium]
MENEKKAFTKERIIRLIIVIIAMFGLAFGFLLGLRANKNLSSIYESLGLLLIALYALMSSVWAISSRHKSLKELTINRDLTEQDKVSIQRFKKAIMLKIPLLIIFSLVVGIGATLYLITRNRFWVGGSEFLFPIFILILWTTESVAIVRILDKVTLPK